MATELFYEVEPGLFLVTYRNSAQLAPANNQALVADMRDSAKAHRRRAVVAFDVGPQIRWVAAAVPIFWLEQTTAAHCPFSAMAIISLSAGVRMAATGFGLSNRIRGKKMSVEVFTDTQTALGWAREKLHQPG